MVLLRQTVIGIPAPQSGGAAAQAQSAQANQQKRKACGKRNRRRCQIIHILQRIQIRPKAHATQKTATCKTREINCHGGEKIARSRGTAKAYNPRIGHPDVSFQRIAPSVNFKGETKAGSKCGFGDPRSKIYVVSKTEPDEDASNEREVKRLVAVSSKPSHAMYIYMPPPSPHRRCCNIRHRLNGR